MKTNSFLKTAVAFAIIFFASCSKDNSSSNSDLTAADVAMTAKIDQSTNDVLDIAQDQYFQQNAAGKGIIPTSSLPACAVITTVRTNTSWTRTIDFGTEGCALSNGNVIKGKIIFTGNVDFTTNLYTISYSFDHFYHNGYLVEGNRTITRTLESTTANPEIHPVFVLTIDMTFTSPDGKVFKRVGTRTREFIVGYNTPLDLNDNVFLITGSWTTTFPNGDVASTTITTPIRIENSCQYKIVSGVLTIIKNDHTAILDYGNGTCDNTATLTIDGGAPTTITFGN